MIHDEDIVGLLLNRSSDPLSMLLAEDQCPEDEQVQRALQMG